MTTPPEVTAAIEHAFRAERNGPADPLVAVARADGVDHHDGR